MPSKESDSTSSMVVRVIGTLAASDADETVMNVYDGGKIIGTLIGGGGTLRDEGWVFTVVNVYVDPAYRNTTALYDLILAAKQMATSRGLILRGSSILNEKLHARLRTMA
jgi:hypothetical protein